MEGITTKKNPNSGFLSVWVHHSADPEKDDRWAKKIRDGMPNYNSYLREYELDFSSAAGIRVFGNIFTRNKYVKEVEADLTRPLDLGIDWGYRNPAALLTQFDELDRWVWLREFIGQEMDSNTFLEVVCWLMDKPMPEGYQMSDRAIQYMEQHRMERWLDRTAFLDMLPEQDRKSANIRVNNYCDVAGTQKSDKGDLTNVKIGNSYPFNLRLKYQRAYIEPGITLMQMRLRERKDGNVGWIFNPKCLISIEGMEGGFIRDERGEVEDTIHTHLFDCGRYIIRNKSNIWKEQREITGQADNNWLKSYKFVNREVTKAKPICYK